MKVKDFLKLFEDCHPDEQVLIETGEHNIHTTPCGIFRRSIPGKPSVQVVIEAYRSIFKFPSDEQSMNNQ